MIEGDLYMFDLREEEIQKQSYVILELKSSECKIYRCAWHKDAGKYEVSVALARLAEKINNS